MSLRANKVDVGHKINIHIPDTGQKIPVKCVKIPETIFNTLNELPDSDPFIFESLIDNSKIELVSIHAGNGARLKIRLPSKSEVRSHKWHFVTLEKFN